MWIKVLEAKANVSHGAELPGQTSGEWVWFTSLRKLINSALETGAQPSKLHHRRQQVISQFAMDRFSLAAMSSLDSYDRFAFPGGHREDIKTLLF